jgi:23S rRNA pseudouridine2605 synthase
MGSQMTTRRPPSPRAAGRPAGPDTSGRTGHGLARVLSKLGFCSRAQGERLVRAGRVSVDGRVVTDPEHRTDPGRDRIAVDGAPVEAESPVYLMMNKPRGLLTTRDDPQGRPTVYSRLEGLGLPHVAPVGRLDKASEGLLLFTNDTAFASAVLEGEHAPHKTYHVRIDTVPADDLVARLAEGIEDGGEILRAVSVDRLRTGTRNAWLRIVLDEGRNRHIRRLLAAHGVETLRLVRVAIGPLELGDLPKGATRALTPAEIAALRPPPPS